MAEMIYGKIAEAMKRIGAIGKESKNAQQGFMYRGIDAVYNALNPVMSELGLFICPEILEQRREERTTKNGTALTYSILTVKYTVYATDGSHVECTVIGEGMDSGDKASNKAMSVAMKYAMFQLFFIPTEAVDPDAECHTDVLPKGKKPDKPEKTDKPEKRQDAPATVEQAQKLPTAKTNPVLDYLAKERQTLREARGISNEDNTAIWVAQVAKLKEAGLIPNKALSTFTKEEATAMVNYMYAKFDPHGVELLPNDRQTA